MQKSYFLKSSFFYSIGIFGSKVVLFVLVPFYSFFLTKEELGEYDLLLVSITFLTPLITIQLSDAVYRFLLQEKDKSQIISTGLKLLLLGFLGFLLIAIIVNYFIHYHYFVEFMFLQLSSCLFIFFQQIIRGLKKNKLYAFMGTANALLVISLSVSFLVFFKMKLQGIILALFIAQIISVVTVVVIGKIYKEISFIVYYGNTAKNLIVYSWPLLPNAISWWLIDLGNRYIILFFLSQEYNGIYAIAARYAGIIALVNSVFILSWQDFTISDNQKDRIGIKKASQIFNQFIAFEMASIIVLTALAKYLIQLTTDLEYHGASNYLPILLFSAGLSAFCAFYGAFYLKSKDTIGVFTTTLIGGLINMVISIVLIDYLGLYGVAIGSLLGFAITLIFRMNKFKLKVNYKLFSICIITYFGVLMLQYIDSNFLMIFLILFSLIFFFMVNRRVINSFIFKTDKNMQ